MNDIDLKGVSKLVWNGQEIQKLVRCSDGAVIYEAAGEIQPVCYLKLHNAGQPLVFNIRVSTTSVCQCELKDISSGDYKKILLNRNFQTTSIEVPSGDYFLYFPRDLKELTTASTRQQTSTVNDIVLEYHKLSSDFNDDDFVFGTSQTAAANIPKYAYTKLSCYDSTPITYLPNFKFKQCSSLKNQTDLVDWDNIRYIGNSPLNSGKIPFQKMPHLEHLGNSAYDRRTEISGTFDMNEYFPELTFCGSYAFRNCNFTELILPAKLYNTGSESFWTQNKNVYLTSITLNEGLHTIGSWAFKYFAGHYIKIPKSVSMIEYGAFENCTRNDNHVDFDFSEFENVPTIHGRWNGTDWMRCFGKNIQNIKLIVPDRLYSDFCAAPTWDSWSQAIVKESDYRRI